MNVFLPRQNFDRCSQNKMTLDLLLGIRHENMRAFNTYEETSGMY